MTTTEVKLTKNAAVTTLRDLGRSGWREIVAKDPALSVDASKPPVADLGPWVTVRDGGVAGYLDDQHLVLADMSGDGHAEAVIPLIPVVGQTSTALLVYVPTAAEPALVGDRAFYTPSGLPTQGSVESGELVIRQAVGAGWEPPCCPSGTVTRRFRTAGGHLIETAPKLEIGNPVAEGFTIDRFYGFIAARNNDAAYAMLSSAELTRTQASLWPVLWAQAERVQVSMLSTPRADGLVPFRLVLVNPDGRSQAWLGGAGMVYNTPTHSWVIDLLSLQADFG